MWPIALLLKIKCNGISMNNYQSSDSRGLPEVKFGEAVKTCLKKCVTFKGRARRSEYWSFAVFTALVAIVSRFLDGLLGKWFGIEVVRMLTGYIMLLPSIAVAVRRLHDTGRSAWWLVPMFVLSIVIKVMPDGIHEQVQDAIMVVFSILYPLLMLVFFLQDSKRGENKYGPSPKYP